MTPEEIEMIALKWAREKKGKILNNTNVDCFIAGYQKAYSDHRQKQRDIKRELILSLPSLCKEKVLSLNKTAQMNGYECSISTKQEISAFKDLMVALKNAEQYLTELI